MVDKRKINNIAKGKQPSHKNGFKKRRFDSTDTGKVPPDHEVRVLEKRVTPDIPKEYKDFEHLFAEVVDDQDLPKHKPWDHEIVLEEGKTPPFGPIYQLSEIELRILREKLDKDLKKGYIRPSSSPAGFPILFVLKKNRPPRMCVDYRKLNDITIKNRYPLPNITELRDRLSRARIFTAIDLRDRYHLIRIKEGKE
jgi:hypothetical protein